MPFCRHFKSTATSSAPPPPLLKVGGVRVAPDKEGTGPTRSSHIQDRCVHPLPNPPPLRARPTEPLPHPGRGRASDFTRFPLSRSCCAAATAAACFFVGQSTGGSWGNKIKRIKQLVAEYVGHVTDEACKVRDPRYKKNRLIGVAGAVFLGGDQIDKSRSLACAQHPRGVAVRFLAVPWQKSRQRVRFECPVLKS